MIHTDAVTEPKCSGACARDGLCRGAVRRVRINWQGWYTDWYCERAIEVDRANGFLVVPWVPEDNVPGLAPNLFEMSPGEMDGP